ncbi:MAG: hypothetical protein PHY43_07935 [Verrucomicrobiales bacterium]|nr:hypothetical protein [Verrucomicrobiales bacterium]
MITHKTPSDWITARTLFAPSFVNTANGAEAAVGWSYPHGAQGVILGRNPQFVRQRPADYLKGTETTASRPSPHLLMRNWRKHGRSNGDTPT